jgi:hypothetical protein
MRVALKKTAGWHDGEKIVRRKKSVLKNKAP